MRRSLSDGALAYFTTWCPAGAPVEKRMMVEVTRLGLGGRHVADGSKSRRLLNQLTGLS